MKKIGRYKLEIILIFLQLCGPYVGVLGLILACFYSFYVISFKTRIDILQIFLLLIPAIVFRSILAGEVSNDGSVENFIWYKLNIPTLINSHIIGPINVSVKLAMSFGVLVRLILTIKKQKHFFLFFIWLICLLISMYGLYLSRSIGLESSSGLTVGLRTVLSIGAILIPLTISSNHNLIFDIIIITKISILIFLFGFMTNHWFFIFPCLLPFLYSSHTNKMWKFLSVLVSLMLLIMNYSFTLKITVLLSWLLIYINDNKFLFKKLYNYKFSKIIFFVSPFLIIFYAIKDTSLFSLTNDDGLVNYFQFKFFADRGALWFYTTNLILSSDFWVVPAGRDILVSGSTYGDVLWGAGAHNIYLEMARQLGLFVTILLTVIMSFTIIKIIKFTNKKNNLGKLGLVFAGVYLVFGMTGNSLIYDGVGFFFWLICGLIYKIHEDFTSISSK